MVAPLAQAPADKGEVHDLLQGVLQVYGYDFTGYAQPSILRRVQMAVEREKLPGVAALAALVLSDQDAMERLLLDFSVNTTAMFRDPGFWHSLRQTVVPHLRTFPVLRAWSVGCSTGEEVWSLAILLHEEGLAARSRIYATDFNQAVLERARAGIFPLHQMRTNTENYLAAGGREEFSNYYTAAHGGARFAQDLVHNVCFAQHNLTCDGEFNEFQLVLCRNVLIYFGPALQNRVHGLLHASLAPLGTLGLGDKETLRFSQRASDYEPVDARQRVYRRVK